MFSQHRILPCIVFLIAVASSAYAASSTVAPAAPGEPVSARFKVTVDRQSAPVYIASVLCIEQIGTKDQPEKRLAGEAAFASFALGDKPAEVVVTSQSPISSVKLLPTSYGLKPKINGSTVSFSVSHPSQITVEVNGDWNNSLHVFANPPEKDAPRADDPNVVYFGPGVHKITRTFAKPGQTVYVADGAIVYGQLTDDSKHGPVFFLPSNTKLRGTGIIDASLIPKPTPHGDIIEMSGTNIRVEGVILRDSPGWNVPVNKSQHVTFDNIKIFGWRGNSDGIDINNSSDVIVRNSFFRTFDDDVVIKSSDPTGPPTKNVHVSRCISWNEIAHPFSLGAEINADCEDITFEDCDVIHDKGREWVLRVYNSGPGHVRNVTFENIRIEEARRPISLWIGSTIWVKLPERGHIDSVVFRKIRCASPDNGRTPVELVGVDAEHAITDIVFEDVKVGDKALVSTDIKQNSFVSGMAIKP